MSVPGTASSSRHSSLLSIPCYWDALLLGVASGAVVGAHRFRGSRSALAAADWAVKMTCATSLGAFVLCRMSFHESRAQAEGQLRVAKERRAGEGGAGSLSPAAGDARAAG
jgi:hypothetical protein